MRSRARCLLLTFKALKGFAIPLVFLNRRADLLGQPFAGFRIHALKVNLRLRDFDRRLALGFRLPEGFDLGAENIALPLQAVRRVVAFEPGFGLVGRVNAAATATTPRFFFVSWDCRFRPRRRSGWQRDERYRIVLQL